MKKFIQLLISGSDIVSSNRVVGLVTLLIFFIVGGLTLGSIVALEPAKVVLEYLLFIISAALFASTLSKFATSKPSNLDESKSPTIIEYK